ncbi:uncharacterized protein LOC113311697 [Papaver somniferum]|uniref:uncharacterized protein LOC113311697 n=1 Tax=Papaver somniferum TaxID=3469 RepID=UPI000E6F6EC5|nr:uncharacterized protein LOC113311697 [Papaver somniferum]
MQEIGKAMMHCPSFSSYSSSIRFVEIAAKVIKAEEEEECTSHPHDNEQEFGFQTFSDDKTKQTPIREEENDHGNDKEDKPEKTTNGEENDGEDEDDDFEFAFVNCSDDNASLPITADEIFCNGIIKPIFPIFNQDIAKFESVEEEEVLLKEDKHKDTNDNATATTSHKIRKVSSCPRLPLGRLFLKEYSSSTSSSTSSSSETDLDSASYCIWKPKTFTTSPDHTYCPNKKSKSVGNSNKPRGFRLKDLIRRSNSDISKTYVYLDNHIAQPLPTMPSTSKKTPNEKSLESIMRKNSLKGSKEDAKPMGRKLSMKKVNSTAAGNETLSAAASLLSPHEMHYLRNKAVKDGDKRRSFLPYKRDLIGFFGFNRKLYPFA